VSTDERGGLIAALHHTTEMVDGLLDLTERLLVSVEGNVPPAPEDRRAATPRCDLAHATRSDAAAARQCYRGTAGEAAMTDSETADGQRFLELERVGGGKSFTFLLNWLNPNSAKVSGPVR
jgi:hypothetical protein